MQAISGACESKSSPLLGTICSCGAPEQYPDPSIGSPGSTVMAAYGYDNLGRVAGIARANGVSTTNSYDSSDTSWSTAMSGASPNGSFAMAYTPGGQLYARTIAGSGSL